ncbi:F0F1 ATP synthase subunit B [Candidatus Margulisiibacteriota bacterium]
MQMVNFLILLWLLNRFLIRPLLKFMDKREEGIKKNIAQAEANKKSTEELLETKKGDLKQARQDARDILAKAESDTKKERQAMLNQTRNEAQRVLENAKKEIERDFNSAKVELKGYLADITVNLAEKVIRKQLDKKTQEDLVKDYLGTIQDK